MLRNPRVVKVCALVLCFAFPAQAFGQVGGEWLLAQNAPPPAVAAEKDCNESREVGKADASSRHGNGKWVAGGVVGGLLLSLIGTGVMTALAANSSPQPKDIPAGVKDTCYMNGFTDKAKSKNTRGALLGGLLGTVVVVAVAVSVAD